MRSAPSRYGRPRAGPIGPTRRPRWRCRSYAPGTPCVDRPGHTRSRRCRRVLRRPVRVGVRGGPARSRWLSHVHAAGPRRRRPRAADEPRRCRRSGPRYITVADADATAARVGELGGRSSSQPMDVMTAGRMAVCTDPAGAAFSLWQAGDHAWARAWPTSRAAFAWNELMTDDVEGAKAFYGALFGWEAETVAGAMPYTEFKLDGRSVAGMMAKPPDHAGRGPAHVGGLLRRRRCRRRGGDDHRVGRLGDDGPDRHRAGTVRGGGRSLRRRLHGDEAEGRASAPERRPRSRRDGRGRDHQRAENRHGPARRRGGPPGGTTRPRPRR